MQPADRDACEQLSRRRLDSALFLRAERGSDGARPFTISEGDPLPTSYGEDSYRKVFDKPVGAAVATLPERHRQ